MKDNINEMSEVFKILSNDVRLCILIQLCRKGEQKVTNLKNCSGSSQSFVSQQLSKLKAYKIVSCRKEGTEIYYYLTDKRICNIIRKLELGNSNCHEINKEE